MRSWRPRRQISGHGPANTGALAKEITEFRTFAFRKQEIGHEQFVLGKVVRNRDGFSEISSVFTVNMGTQPLFGKRQKLFLSRGNHDAKVLQYLRTTDQRRALFENQALRMHAPKMMS